MRLVFIDMHCINFLVRTYGQIKEKRKLVSYKHKFILDYAFENNITVCNYISGKESQIDKRDILKRISQKNIYLWEHNYVMQNSFQETLNIKPILDAREIKDDDLVIGYFYLDMQRNIIKDLPGHKIMFGNHFIAINNPVDLDELGVEGFINEIDLSDNEFVRRYIKFSGDYIVCPYIFADRFVDQGKDRINKMMAIGTASTCSGHRDYALYRKMFGTEDIQTMRMTILNSADKYSEYIDSYISHIHEDKVRILSTDSSLTRRMKKFINSFIPWRQSRYMSFNMVDKFNEYAFFACPEENVGMPGIGFVEGMACGTTYIGLDTTYYRKLGLIPGKHYITYDGSIGDLIEKIKYCQNNYDEVRKIGIEGQRLVRETFNRRVVASNLFKKFEEIISKGMASEHE